MCLSLIATHKQCKFKSHLQERTLCQIDRKSTFKSKFMFHLQSLFLWKCTTVCWIHQIGAALKFCWSSSKLFILYQSQRSEPGLHSKVKTICRESNKSALASLELTLPATITGAIWTPFVWMLKHFCQLYISCVKSFYNNLTFSLAAAFCDNKFSAFWRQFHNRKGKLEGSWYIIYSFGTFPPSYRKRCSNNTYYVDFTWWLDMESFLSNLAFLVTIFTMRLRYF